MMDSSPMMLRHGQMATIDFWYETCLDDGTICMENYVIAPSYVFLYGYIYGISIVIVLFFIDF